MSRRPPFDFDISVTADKKRRARGARILRRGRDLGAGLRAAGLRQARQVPGAEIARPPRRFPLVLPRPRPRVQPAAGTSSSRYSDDDLERHFAADRVWGRPTRPFGDAASRAGTQPHAEGRAWQRFGFDDPMELLGDKATLNPGGERVAARRAAPAAADRAPRARDPRRAGQPVEDRDPPAVQGAGQGPAPGHERRPPRRRGAARRGGLGLGADQGAAAASATSLVPEALSSRSPMRVRRTEPPAAPGVARRRQGRGQPRRGKG